MTLLSRPGAADIRRDALASARSSYSGDVDAALRVLITLDTDGTLQDSRGSCNKELREVLRVASRHSASKIRMLANRSIAHLLPVVDAERHLEGVLRKDKSNAVVFDAMHAYAQITQDPDETRRLLWQQICERGPVRLAPGLGALQHLGADGIRRLVELMTRTTDSDGISRRFGEHVGWGEEGESNELFRSVEIRGAAASALLSHGLIGLENWTPTVPKLLQFLAREPGGHRSTMIALFQAHGDVVRLLSSPKDVRSARNGELGERAQELGAILGSQPIGRAEVAECMASQLAELLRRPDDESRNAAIRATIDTISRTGERSAEMKLIELVKFDRLPDSGVAAAIDALTRTANPHAWRVVRHVNERMMTSPGEHTATQAAIDRAATPQSWRGQWIETAIAQHPPSACDLDSAFAGLGSGFDRYPSRTLAARLQNLSRIGQHVRAHPDALTDAHVTELTDLAKTPFEETKREELLTAETAAWLLLKSRGADRAFSGITHGENPPARPYVIRLAQMGLVDIDDVLPEMVRDRFVPMLDRLTALEATEHDPLRSLGNDASISVGPTIN